MLNLNNLRENLFIIGNDLKISLEDFNYIFAKND